MTDNIVLDSIHPDLGLASMRSSIQTLEKSIAKEIEGKSKLELVTAYNEIKKEYDDLLTMYRSIFLENLETAEEALDQIRTVDELIGDAIKQMY